MDPNVRNDSSTTQKEWRIISAEETNDVDSLTKANYHMVDQAPIAKEDPCKGMKQIITGFSKWSDRYISSCSDQKNHQHQAKRMQKWSGILNKRKRVEIEFTRIK